MNQHEIRKFRHNLRRFERLVVSHFKGFGCCEGVSLAQCHALMEIDGQGPLNLGELAGSLGLDKSTLSRTVDGLVNIGLVERKPHPRDRRSILLSLTDQGQRTCDNINANNDALFLRVFNRIDPQTRGDIAAHFQTLVETMACETGENCSSCLLTEGNG
ncbi:MAG: MarR family transcriptional regulator [Desulfosarcinaceae bacterium]